MAIKDWPPGEGPREKLAERGPQALSDAELLGILIGSGTRKHDAVGLGRALIDQAGNLSRLARQDFRSLTRLPGIGQAKALRLSAAFALGTRMQGPILKVGEGICNPQDVQSYLKAKLANLEHEVFAVLFLDNRHRIIEYDPMFRGTIDGASVYPREVAKRALQLNAAALIVAHNHPSGVAEPSSADRSLTRRLREALELVDLRLLDHIVVTYEECVSFAERGWL